MDNDEAFVAGLVRLSVPINRIAQSENAAGRRGMNATQMIRLGNIERRKTLQTNTPYGTVGKKMSVERDGADDFGFEYMCPFAVVFELARRSPRFAQTLVTCLRGSPAKICFYVDEVKPGNALRPEKARTYQAFYWTILQLPDRLRTRGRMPGWITLAIIPSESMIDAGLSMSVLMATLLKTFWTSNTNEHSLSRTGVRIPFHGHDSLHFKAEFSCFMMDEKALAEVCSVKGPSGTKCCQKCRNVVGRVPAESVIDGLVHYSCPDLSSVQLHTTGTVREMARRLRAAADAGEAIEELEKFFGLKYEAGAIPFDEEAAEIAKTPDSAYSDWMHGLCASGGMSQYEVNQLVRKLLAQGGVTLQTLDEFTKSVRMPKTASRLGPKFWRKRIVNKPKRHMRAFASEMLTAIFILGAFLDAVIKPLGSLPDHVRCFDSLRTLVCIFESGSRALLRIGLLRTTLREHHEMYVELYADCIKPKLHYLRHIPDVFEDFGTALSCFSTERKHKESKKIVAHARIAAERHAGQGRLIAQSFAMHKRSP